MNIKRQDIMSAVKVTVDDEDFRVQTIACEKYILKFGAPWCMPCKQDKPKYAMLAQTWRQWQFLDVDVDECSETATKYGIRSIPAYFMIYRNNRGHMTTRRVDNINMLERELNGTLPD